MTCSRALRITPLFGGACRVLPGPRGRAQAFGGGGPGRRPRHLPAVSLPQHPTGRCGPPRARPRPRRAALAADGGCGFASASPPRQRVRVGPRPPVDIGTSTRANRRNRRAATVRLGLQGCPPRGVRPRRWRCGCRARTARRSRRWGRVCESTTTATGRPRGRPPPWRRTGRRRSARRPRRAGCPLTPRLRREHATANGSGLAPSATSTVGDTVERCRAADPRPTVFAAPARPGDHGCRGNRETVWWRTHDCHGRGPCPPTRRPAHRRSAVLAGTTSAPAGGTTGRDVDRPDRSPKSPSSGTTPHRLLWPWPPCHGSRTVRPQSVREAWSTGAEVAGAPWQTRRPPPPREPGPDAAQVGQNPRLLDPGPTPLPPESKGNGLRLAGEPSLG